MDAHFNVRAHTAPTVSSSYSHNKVLKNTPNDHADRKPLEEAVFKVSSIAECVAVCLFVVVVVVVVVDLLLLGWL